MKSRPSNWGFVFTKAGQRLEVTNWLPGDWSERWVLSAAEGSGLVGRWMLDPAREGAPHG
jgi:hypothetical protein